jgi:putative ABC transport system permease protein
LTIKNVFRIIKRDSLSLVINMTGLSLGLAASILLSAFIMFELSFDRHFKHADRIYRLNSIWISEGETSHMPINLRQAYSHLPSSTAGIESAVQIYRGFQSELTLNENRYQGLQLLYADSGFFQIFDLALVEGNLEFALLQPNAVILTRSIAKRIFGSSEALGQTVKRGEKSFVVTAVLEDIPPNTHFDFDILMPMSAVDDLVYLGGLEFFTYYLFEEGTDYQDVAQTICKENTRLLTERFSDVDNATFSSTVEPLKRLHLHSAVSWDLTPPGSLKNILIMLVIVIIVMFLALSNFVNLYILNGARRSKEIGIRKAYGAGRKRMIFQFYYETSVVVTIAFLAGTLLALLLIPEFGRIMHRDSYMEIARSPGLYLVLIAVYIATILASGFYPALLLSRAAPVPLMHGEVNPAGDKKMLLGIVSILQVSTAIFLLATLLGINAQTRYLKHLSPGYNPEGIILVSNLNKGLVEDYPALREQLLNMPGIEKVAASVHTIGAGYSGQYIRMASEQEKDNKTLSEYRIQPGLCSLYEFELLHGRFMDPDRIADRNSIIFNEAAVTMLGHTPESIVGELVVMHEDPLEVVGVVSNFLYESAAREVEPLAITAYQDWIRTISVRVGPGTGGEIIKQLKETIRAFDEEYVMVHRYATDIYKGYYLNEEWLRIVLGAGSVLSILIVLLGIWALVSHSTLSRSKEIGIRKVLGGTSGSIISLIFTSNLKWTLMASFLATPLAWIYMKSWLTDYAIRIPLHWWIFAASILVVMLFQALITLGQTWKAANRNPVEAIRYE